MKSTIFRTVLMLIITLPTGFLNAQTTTGTETYPFNDPSLEMEERIEDLINRLTLEEKAWQMMHNSPAVERLGIPEYNWWNEALHGIGRSGVATVFPQAIGMGATFDENLILEVAELVNEEGESVLESGEFKIYVGGSSPGNRSTELGVQKLQEATFTLR